MPGAQPGSPDSLPSHEPALSRWDNEGGALCEGPQKRAGSSAPSRGEALRLNKAELTQLRARVIALEDLLAVLLAEGPARQVEVALAMAACISPEPGLTDHPLTLHAAARMIDRVERSGHVRPGRTAERPPAKRADRGG